MGRVNGVGMYCTNDRIACVQDAVISHHGSGLRRTLVFSANVAAADEAAEQLQRAGMQPLVYHRKIPADERAHALTFMAAR